MSSSRGSRTGALTVAATTMVALSISACGDGPIEPPGGGPNNRAGFATCDLNLDYVIAGAARDGIPSLDDPIWWRADERLPDYLDPNVRVVGFSANGQAWAVPLNTLWRHEIVNIDTGGPNAPRIAVTYCPLTGSSLVFDRASVGGATLGVSGLLFMNNLMLYDRRDPDDTLWPQMIGAARCGSRKGSELTRYPFVEVEWETWLALHPETLVLAGPAEQGFDPIRFSYDSFRYPYDNYRETPLMWAPNNFPTIDLRRFSKERVLGVPSTLEPPQNEPGIAFPFGALQDQPGDLQAIHFDIEGEAAVLLWSDAAQGGAPFRSVTTSGASATLQVVPGGFQDAETGSEWTLDGRAVSGAMAGERLAPLPQWHTAFWAPWAAFNPDTRLWEGP